MTETWLQERYQLERGLRLQLDKCEAKRSAGTSWMIPAISHQPSALSVGGQP